jgi:hypothetical protein
VRRRSSFGYCTLKRRQIQYVEICQRWFSWWMGIPSEANGTNSVIGERSHLSHLSQCCQRVEVRAFFLVFFQWYVYRLKLLLALSRESAERSKPVLSAVEGGAKWRNHCAHASIT